MKRNINEREKIIKEGFGSWLARQQDNLTAWANKIDAAKTLKAKNAAIKPHQPVLDALDKLESSAAASNPKMKLKTKRIQTPYELELEQELAHLKIKLANKNTFFTPKVKSKINNLIDNTIDDTKNKAKEKIVDPLTTLTPPPKRNPTKLVLKTGAGIGAILAVDKYLDNEKK
jgi:hypothetical protein